LRIEAVMQHETTVLLGIKVPSTDPLFLAMVGFHVLVGLTCVVTGAIAMLSAKGPGRHPTFGTIYFWALALVFVSASELSIVRWAEDYHLFILGSLSFAAALLGRTARRGLWRGWAQLHIIGMGVSYIFMLTAFYVDNGPNLPLWRELPHVAFWLLPSAIGVPLMLYALFRHPVVHRRRPLVVPAADNSPD
jgi:uncharacterized membrane protein